MDHSRPTGAGILAFAFGDDDLVEANEALKEVACAGAWVLDAPVFAEYGCRIAAIDVPNGVQNPATAITEDGPPSTLRVCRAALPWIALHDLKEIHVVAAPDHLRRAMRDMELALAEHRNSATVHAYEPDVLSEIHSSGFWFPTVLARLKWIIREWTLLRMPLWAYKGIAG